MPRKAGSLRSPSDLDQIAPRENDPPDISALTEQCAAILKHCRLRREELRRRIEPAESDHRIPPRKSRTAEERRQDAERRTRTRREQRQAVLELRHMERLESQARQHWRALLAAGGASDPDGTTINSRRSRASDVPARDSFEWFCHCVDRAWVTAWQPRLDAEADATPLSAPNGEAADNSQAAWAQVIERRQQTARDLRRYDVELERVWVALAAQKQRSRICDLLDAAAGEKGRRRIPTTKAYRDGLLDHERAAQDVAKRAEKVILKAFEQALTSVQEVFDYAGVVDGQEEREAFLPSGKWRRAWSEGLAVEKMVKGWLALVRTPRPPGRPGRRASPLLNKAILKIIALLEPKLGVKKAIVATQVLLWRAGVWRTPDGDTLRARYYELRKASEAPAK